MSAVASLNNRVRALWAQHNTPQFLNDLHEMRRVYGYVAIRPELGGSHDSETVRKLESTFKDGLVNAELADRPTRDTDGIEVTPEMIEAGADALMSIPGSLDLVGDPGEIVGAVFASMCRVRASLVQRCLD